MLDHFSSDHHNLYSDEVPNLNYHGHAAVLLFLIKIIIIQASILMYVGG